jgi:hypothetical protein
MQFTWPHELNLHLHQRDIERNNQKLSHAAPRVLEAETPKNAKTKYP